MKTEIIVIMDKLGLTYLKQAQQQAARLTASKMLAEKIDQQQIPMAEGTLQNVYTYVDDEYAKNGLIRIITEGPYAARLYYNPQYDFNKEFNTHARGEWWKDFISGKQKHRPYELYSYFYKRESGGYVE